MEGIIKYTIKDSLWRLKLTLAEKITVQISFLFQVLHISGSQQKACMTIFIFKLRKIATIIKQKFYVLK